jgi:Kef-type K+ transport system membrane component KefB
MVQQPETAWQTIKRTFNSMEVLAVAVLGPILLMAGLGWLVEWLTDRTGKALILGVVVSFSGIVMIYETLRRLGWIGRRG